MKIFRLSSDDPFANLAAERYILESCNPNEELLLLYVNRPCVVVGRSQNPFQESSLSVLAHKGLDLVRRYTGGGTVYHDRGNLNFALIRPRHSFDKYENSRQILAALKSLSIAGEVTERNDLVARGRKFSGSAYRLMKDRALHHGTLLVSADLALLRQALKPTLPGISGKGVPSVSSPVVSLSELSPGLAPAEVAAALIDFFGGDSCNVGPDHEFYAESGSFAAELHSWQWRLGRTPAFTVPLSVDGSVFTTRVQGGLIDPGADLPYGAGGSRLDSLVCGDYFSD